MRSADDRGYAMAALLVGMSIMAIMMSIALPAWRSAAQREKEAELIFRGEQYARAVTLFQRRFPGQFPPNLDVLLSGKFLRKRYKDPMTEDGEFQLVLAGQAGTATPTGGGAPGQPQGAQQRTQQVQTTLTPQGGQSTLQFTQPGAAGAGITGVVSKSPVESMRLYNGRGKYNEWAFIATQTSTQAGTGGGGAQAPGAPGQRGGPAGRGGQPTPAGRGVAAPAPGRGIQQPPPGRGQTSPFPPARGRGF